MPESDPTESNVPPTPADDQPQASQPRAEPADAGPATAAEPVAGPSVAEPAPPPYTGAYAAAPGATFTVPDPAGPGIAATPIDASRTRNRQLLRMAAATGVGVVVGLAAGVLGAELASDDLDAGRPAGIGSQQQIQGQQPGRPGQGGMQDGSRSDRDDSYGTDGSGSSDDPGDAETDSDDGRMAPPDWSPNGQGRSQAPGQSDGSAQNGAGSDGTGSSGAGSDGQSGAS